MEFKERSFMSKWQMTCDVCGHVHLDHQGARLEICYRSSGLLMQQKLCDYCVASLRAEYPFQRIKRRKTRAKVKP